MGSIQCYHPYLVSVLGSDGAALIVESVGLNASKDVEKGEVGVVVAALALNVFVLGVGQVSERRVEIFAWGMMLLKAVVDAERLRG